MDFKIEQHAPTLDISLRGFIEAIEWRDPLVIGILLFHVTVTLMALMTRNHSNFQLVLFLALLLLVYFSENINRLASDHWRLVASQQYFDNTGMFISLIFSVPILLNCMVMMASWLWQSSELMVQLKSAQLKQIKRRASQELPDNNKEAIKENKSGKED